MSVSLLPCMFEWILVLLRKLGLFRPTYLSDPFRVRRSPFNWSKASVVKAIRYCVLGDFPRFHSINCPYKEGR